MKILFTGGGSGGHVYPLISIIRELRRLSDQKILDIYYIGPKEEFGTILLSEETITVKTIFSGKLRRYFSFQNFVDIVFKIPLGFIQSFFYLLLIRPRLVFSKGGSGALPVTFCARILRIPVFIHESDSLPGMSNRITSKWAKRIFITFPKTEFFDLSRVTVVGNPIREEILAGDQKTAQDIFHLTLSKPLLLFLGGSQGAQPINDFVLRILNKILETYEIIHVTGRENLKEVRQEAQAVINKDFDKYYHPEGYLDQPKMRHALAAANLVISRAGAASIAEISACGKPSILIPLPSAAQNHQSQNAYEYAKTGAAILIEQENLTPSFFMDKLSHLFLHPEEMEKMKTEALRFSKPEAARTIAVEILEYLSPKQKI